LFLIGVAVGCVLVVGLIVAEGAFHAKHILTNAIAQHEATQHAIAELRLVLSRERAQYYDIPEG
jgi:predicted Kef-type K+ transport protein